MAGPAAIVAGAPLMATKLSFAVTEFTVMLPLPTFRSPRGCETGCGFEVCVENDSRLVAMASCGGAAPTVKDTGIFWLFPAQGLGAAQVTTMEVCKTPAPSVKACGSRLTPMAPGVVPPPDTSS